VTGTEQNSAHDEFTAEDRTEFLVLTLAVAILSLLYIGLPNFRFFSDGVQFAVEMKYSSDWILHPHHVLYPLLPQIVRKLTGFGEGDMDFLVGWSHLMGILSLIGMVFLLRKLTDNMRAVIIGLVLFGLTNGVWYFSVTPNQNSTPLMFGVFTLLLIVDTSQRNLISTWRILALALMIAIATLGSQVNAALIFPAAAVMFHSSQSGRVKSAKSWFLILATILITLLTTILICVKFGKFSSAADFINWQNSYAYQSRWWVSGIGDAITRNIKGITELTCGNLSGDGGLFGPPNILARPVQIIVYLILLIEIFTAFAAYIKNKLRLPLQTLGLLVAIPIFLFSIFYIPQNMNLRVLYVPGFLIFLLPSIEQRYMSEKANPKLRILPILLLVLLLISNLLGKYLHERTPESNLFLQQTEEATRYISPDDIIIYPWTDDGHTQALYMQYYIGCDALTANKLMQIEAAIPEDDFRAFVFGPDRNRNVWLHDELIVPSGTGVWLTTRYEHVPSQEECHTFIQKWFGEDSGELENVFPWYYRFKLHDTD